MNHSSTPTITARLSQRRASACGLLAATLLSGCMRAPDSNLLKTPNAVEPDWVHKGDVNQPDASQYYAQALVPPFGFTSVPYLLSGANPCSANDLAGYAGGVINSLHGNNPSDLTNNPNWWLVDCTQPGHMVTGPGGTQVYYVFNIIQALPKGGKNSGWAVYSSVPGPVVVATYQTGSQ